MFTEYWASVGRKQTAVAMVVCAASTCACALLTQATHPSPRDLLGVARPLTNTEIEAMLGASRKALTAKTFRLTSSHGNQGPEVLMGRAGQPRIIRFAGAVEGGTVGGVVRGDGTSGRPVETHWRREFIKIIDYTSCPARRCGESAEQGALVVEYELDGPTKAWTTTARQRDARDFGGWESRRSSTCCKVAGP